MRRETQNVLLLLFGGALLKIALNGSYLRYVKPSLLPLLVVASVVLIALAGVAIARDIRGDPVSGEHGTRSPGLLALPVFAIFLIAPPALGADSVARDGIAVPARPAESSFPALPPGEPLLPVSEFVTRAVWDSTGELNGRAVRLRGFVVHPEPGRTQLARMRISCCAADASPVVVELAAPRAARLPEDTWLEVTGRLRPGSPTPQNDHVPTLEPTRLRPIEAPPDPYES